MENNTSKANHKNSILIFSFLPFLLILISFFLETPKELFSGLYKIILAPDVLLVDYLAIGGLGATFLNAGLITFICIGIIIIFKVKLTGPLMAAVITITGFAFMGKNIVNVLPIFLGGFLYAKFKNLDIKDIIVPVFFVTTVAPAVTHIALGLGLNYWISIPLAILVGIAIGFVVSPMASHFVLFHDGHNLYNIGFTGGIIGTLIAVLIRGFGFSVEPQAILSTEYSIFIRNFLILVSTMYIIIGFLINKRSLKTYLHVFKHSGRLFTSFIDELGFGLAYINMGFMGLVGIIYVILVKGTFNGPVAAGVLTAIAFAPFGKNPKNTIPVMIGVFIAATIKVFDPSSTSMVIAALFGTTLAPIAGVYGPIPGMIAGFLHVSMVSSLITIHGGLNLYNNGFSGGVVAAIMTPILNIFFNKKERVD